MKQTEPFPNRALSQEHLQKEDGDVWKPFFLCFWCLLLAVWFCGNRLQGWPWLCHTAKDSQPQAEGTRFCQGLENGLAGTLLEPLFMLKDCLSPTRVGQSPWVTRASFERGGKEASWRITGAGSLLALSPPPVCLLHQPVLKWCCRKLIQYRKEEAGLQQVRTITFFPSSS